MHALEPLTECGDLGCNLLWLLQQRPAQQVRHLWHMLPRDAPTHNLRRADTDTVQVTLNRIDRQADATDQKIRPAQTFRGRLATAPPRRGNP